MSGKSETEAFGADREKIDGKPEVLELNDVDKSFGDTVAVRDLNLGVREGELLTLLGPSGCGKTTTLRLIAGLEKPDEGSIDLKGERIAGEGRHVEPEERGVGVVFQDFALFPHMTVEENITFGLDDLDEKERDERADEMLDLVNLEAQRDKSPEELSGGQRQRVALARSLAPEPDVLLLDEPFSNLDVGLRVEMREEVRRILKDAGVTAVSVTHDQEEALSISDRIAVMNSGTVVQVGQPQEVFEQPESRFVADFLGNASFISGHVTSTGVETPIGEISLELVEGLTPDYEGAEVEILIRPDDATVVPVDGPESADGEVVYRQYDGPNFVYRVELENGEVVRCMHNHTDDFELGTPVSISLEIDHSLAWYPSE